MSWSTSTALFHNGWETNSVCTRVHLGKRKVRQRNHWLLPILRLRECFERDRSLSLYLLPSTSCSSSKTLSWRWRHDSPADLSLLHVVSNPRKCNVSCLLSTCCCSKRWRLRSAPEGVCGDNSWVIQRKPTGFWTFKRKVLTILLLCIRHTGKTTSVHTWWRPVAVAFRNQYTALFWKHIKILGNQESQQL